jgi:ubiquitin carboxyl-terminal hydrolase 36/42
MAMQEAGRGLANLGNTYFLSAVLHCLMHSPPLRAVFLSSGHSHCPIAAKGRFCVLCALQIYTRESELDSATTRPTALVRLQGILPSFAHGRQEDAQEYIRFLLDALQKAQKQAGIPPHIAKLVAGWLRSRVVCPTADGRVRHSTHTRTSVSLSKRWFARQSSAPLDTEGANQR